MKISRNQIRRIIREQKAVVTKDAIKDVVMDILSDEGGAAGLDPIESALEDLEDEDISLPDEPIEDIVSDVTGVKRHADGDFIDTTQLEGVLKLTPKQLRKIIREAVSLKTLQDLEGRPHTDPKFKRGSNSIPRGGTADYKEDGSYFRDVIVMSPNGDSVLVDGRETYIQDVPQQLEYMGFPMGENDADNLIFALEEMEADGYIELMVTYENGVWSW